MTAVSKVPQGNLDNLWHTSLSRSAFSASFAANYPNKSLYNSYLAKPPAGELELAVGLLIGRYK
jgi:hypothetical protein